VRLLGALIAAGSCLLLQRKISFPCLISELRLSMKVRPRRSVLYMPGSNDRALEKARELPADALILDLEDSVSPEDKVVAREKVCANVKTGGYGQREIVIRPNALETTWGTHDMLAAAEAAPHAILIPKVAHPGDIISAAKILKSVDASEKTRLWAMMETPAAIIHAREIAAVATDPENRFDCLVMGTNDLLKESRARAHGERFAVVPWLSMTIVAARANGLDVVDGVYNNFKDDEGFRRECAHGRTLGMDGKTLIHPSQIAACNEVFAPTEAEVEWSRKIIAAFKKPKNQRKGVITVEGKMVERLHLVMAERTVAIANAVRDYEDWF
jgi:citrate lyase subunit beta / citryl-CoA lyase